VEEITMPCMVAVNVPEEPEKTSDRRSTALPGESVTRGVLDAVPVLETDREGVGVPVAVRVVVGLPVAVSDNELVVDGVNDSEGVIEGVAEPSHT
jgi:hypothetical protein